LLIQHHTQAAKRQPKDDTLGQGRLPKALREPSQDAPR
jgi:hypothetical protein